MAQTLDNLSFSWNNAGTTFTGIKYDVADTASAAGSLLMDLRTSNVSRFKVRKDGQVTFQDGSKTSPAFTFSSGTVGIYSRLAAWMTFTNGTIETFQIDGVGAINCIGSLGLASGDLSAFSPDIFLVREAAGTLAQRRTTNAQTFRIYNTFTTSTDYQRLAVSSATATLTAMSGASVTATALIPAGAVVVGVTARVTTEITGATGFQIGITGALDRWADKTGVAVGTTTDNRDWTAGTIECFPAATDVIVTAKTSNFTAGAMRLVVHYIAGEAD